VQCPDGTLADRLGRRGRQRDRDRRAAADGAVDRDLTAQLLDDAVDRRQSEAGAAAARLGRVERLERALPHAVGHASAVVAYDHRHRVVGQRALADDDLDVAARLHRVARRASRLNCMKTRFQISIKRSPSASGEPGGPPNTPGPWS
jgi:hypothetical protein